MGCLVIFIAVTLCIGSIVFGFDGLCRSSLIPQLPIYPGATVRSETHNFLTQMGIGQTVMTLYSPDSPEVVTPWYGRTIGTYLREVAKQGGTRLGRSDWSVNKAEDGKGSLIVLYGVCGS